MIKVADVYTQITLEPYLIDKNECLSNVLKIFKRINPIHRSLYVVDDHKRLIGIITLQEIFTIYSIEQGFAKAEKFSKMTLLDYLIKDSTVEKIMRMDVSVTVEDDINDAFQLMMRENLQELPVVNDKGIVIGDLNVHEILQTVDEGKVNRHKVNE